MTAISPRRHAFARAAVVLVGLLLCWLAGATPACAHASLMRAEPADGAVVPVAPSAFTLTFNEPVTPLVLRLIAPDGGAVTLAASRPEPETLAIGAPAALAGGTYALSWRVTSQDGHPVGGTVVFSIGAPGGAAPAGAAETGDRAVRTAIWGAKLALYVGLVIGIGGAFFRAWIGSGASPGTSVSIAALLIGLVAVPLSVGLQGLDALDVPLAALAQRAAWEAGIDSAYGVTAILAAFALFAGLFSFATRSPVVACTLSLASLAGMGAALAASGHAAAAEPQWLTRPAVFVHATGATIWMGAFVPLGALVIVGAPEARAALRRFGRVIRLVLAAMIVAGVALALVQFDRVTSLWATAYGQVFLLKLALVAALVGLAAFNRRQGRRAAAGRADAVRTLARSVAVESVVAVMILGLVAGWRFTPPPRALAAAAAEPAAVHIHTDKAMADLKITPGRAGPASATIMIMTGDFGPLDAKEVTLVLANKAAGIEPIRREARKPGDGTWRVDGLTVPVGGRWSVRVEILVTDFEMVRLEDEIVVRP